MVEQFGTRITNEYFIDRNELFKRKRWLICACVINLLMRQIRDDKILHFCLSFNRKLSGQNLQCKEENLITGKRAFERVQISQLNFYFAFKQEL
jgi:hypothetical protein